MANPTYEELTAQNEALRKVLRRLVSVEHEYGGSLQLNGQFAYKVPESIFKSAKQTLGTTPAACLAQVRADVAQEYYYMGWEHSLSTKAEDGDHYACGRRLAKQFADAIRQGGEK
jgi:hypothetical protein